MQVVLLIVAGLTVLVALAWFRPVSRTVFEYEWAVKFARGRFKGLLPPGVHWYSGRFTKIVTTDARPTRICVSGQEVLTSDAIAIKVGIVATFRVVDARRALLETDNYPNVVHTELQLALRSLIGQHPVEQVLARRADVSIQLKSLAAEKLQAIGIELVDAGIRDVTFPGELKKTFSQVARARQDGLAALERARGETAALRSLANAARMVERNPHLMQLRVLQVVGQQPGNTVVVGIPPGAAPFPVHTAPSDEPSSDGQAGPLP